MSHASYTMQHGDSTSFLHGIPTCRKTLRYFKKTCFLRATLNMFFGGLVCSSIEKVLISVLVFFGKLQGPDLRRFDLSVRAIIIKCFRGLRHPHHIRFFGEVFWVSWEHFKKSKCALLKEPAQPGRKVQKIAFFGLFPD